MPSQNSKDEGFSIEQLTDLLQQLSLADHPTSEHSFPTSTRPHPSWQGLPLELLANITQKSFFSNFDTKHSVLMNPADPQPDLTLMRVDQRSRTFFKQKFLPESVIVVIRYGLCRFCSTPEFERHARLFADDSIDPWPSMSNRTSRVFVGIQCYPEEPVTDRTIATLYVPENKINILALSQMVLSPTLYSGVHGKRAINVECTPRDRIGARRSAEVLAFLAKLLHSVLNGPKIITMGTSGRLQRPFKAVIRELYPLNLTWQRADSVHQTLLREIQTLLDKKAVPIHQMVEVSAQAFRIFQHCYDMIGVSPLRPHVQPGEQYELMVGEIHTDCMLFVAFHGLAEHMMQRHRGPVWTLLGEQSPAVVSDILRMQDLIPAMVRKLNFMDQIASHYRIGHHRLLNPGPSTTWHPHHLPYLLHYTAMLQTFIRIRTISLMHFRVSNHTQGYPAAVRPYVVIPTYAGATTVDTTFRNLREHLQALEHLDEIINKLRTAPGAAQIPNTQAVKYDNYQIPDFVKGIRQLLQQVEHGGTRTQAQHWYEQLNTEVLTLPTTYCIPSVSQSDWEWASMSMTFDDFERDGLLP